jgi:hypothetical protein
VRAFAVVLRNGTIVESVHLAGSLFEAGVAAGWMLSNHPSIGLGLEMTTTEDSVEVMDGEYRVDAWPVDAELPTTDLWIGVYVAPEGYLDTVVALDGERSAFQFVLDEPTDPLTLEVLSRDHIVASDDPNDEGGYTHALLVALPASMRGGQ